MRGHVVESRLGQVLPNPLLKAYHLLSNPKGAVGSLSFLLGGGLPLTLKERLSLVALFYRISSRVEGTLRQQEALAFACLVLGLPHWLEGCIVEAGAWKGSGTAKLSLIAGKAGRELIVFDSFEGMPENTEASAVVEHGVEYTLRFSKGDYRATLKDVKRTVSRYGDAQHCRFVKGWFRETMPGFKEPVAAALVDVDLASSTRTCLSHLYPLLVPGGVLVSHDGHLPLVRQAFEDDTFWLEEVGCSRPEMEYAGNLLILRKPSSVGEKPGK